MSDNHKDFILSTQSGAAPGSDIRTIPQLVSAAAARFGDRLFLEEGGTKLSFKDFFEQCFQVASALIAKGITPGDRIAVWAPNIAEWVIAALGAQCAGAILVTLNTRYKGAEAAYILQKSRTKLVFSIGNFLDCDYPAMLANENLPDLNDIIVFRQTENLASSSGAIKQTRWEEFLELSTRTFPEYVAQCMAEVSGDDISDILFTSGTTGNPKGVMTSHEQNLRAFTTFAEIVGLQEGDRYLVINPFFHSFGYKAGILACLTKGVTLLPHAVFNASDILKRIAKDKISVMPGPPTLFQSLLAHPELDKYDISSLKRATTGAAVIPVEMIHQMKNKLGFETIITAYGLTESCGLVTMCRIGDSAETIATTSGRAIPGVELRCVDSENREVPRGEAGEIVFRGFNVMKGYFENEAATQECIDAEGWLHTGDVGVMDEQGNLRITDRLKDMFITGGFNCYPAEIEKIIAGHDGVTMSAVIGIPDVRMGEVAMAFIVPKPGVSLNESDMINWCREKMANYKVPRKIKIVDALPLNASGKVVKPELRKMAVI
ncbi:MAG TPA: FadD3 family acyl-CoA ligase [Pseudomonadales bacterium]|nr:FadD3 family acyl-CoA ligase [Pseudomonadales bacterium]